MHQASVKNVQMNSVDLTLMEDEADQRRVCALTHPCAFKGKNGSKHVGLHERHETLNLFVWTCALCLLLFCRWTTFI